jgi:hypothetical protein
MQGDLTQVNISAAIDLERRLPWKHRDQAKAPYADRLCALRPSSRKITMQAA